MSPDLRCPTVTAPQSPVQLPAAAGGCQCCMTLAAAQWVKCRALVDPHCNGHVACRLLTSQAVGNSAVQGGTALLQREQSSFHYATPACHAEPLGWGLLLPHVHKHAHAKPGRCPAWCSIPGMKSQPFPEQLGPAKLNSLSCTQRWHSHTAYCPQPAGSRFTEGSPPALAQSVTFCAATAGCQQSPREAGHFCRAG